MKNDHRAMLDRCHAAAVAAAAAAAPSVCTIAAAAAPSAADGVSDLPPPTLALLASMPDDLAAALRHTCALLVRAAPRVGPLLRRSGASGPAAVGSRVGSRRRPPLGFLQRKRG